MNLIGQKIGYLQDITIATFFAFNSLLCFEVRRIFREKNFREFCEFGLFRAEVYLEKIYALSDSQMFILKFS